MHTEQIDSTVGRAVIHIDMDCFFAALEMRDQPRLRTVPLIVGGRPGSRGVVATCNYVARRFGIRSAMPTQTAQRLCPHAVFVPSRFDVYRRESGRLYEVLRSQPGVQTVEGAGIDEAYLEIPGTVMDAVPVARALRQRIATKLGVTASAGVAPNKFLAKVASDWNKPNGAFVILPEHVAAFVAELPVANIPGVGKASQARLAKHGITTCGQLQKLCAKTMRELFGSWGDRLAQLCRGIDHRPLQTGRERKSFSVERTYQVDLSGDEPLQRELEHLVAELERRGKASKLTTERITGLHLKLRANDFRTTTVAQAQSCWPPKSPQFAPLLAKAHQRLSNGGPPVPIRLMGIGVKLATADAAASAPTAPTATNATTTWHQLPLFNPTTGLPGMPTHA